MINQQIQNPFIRLGKNSSESSTTETITTEANAAGVTNSSPNTTTNVDTNLKHRITQKSKHREEKRPRFQWSQRMNMILHGIKSAVGNGRGWMKRLHTEWQERLPIYHMFSTQNLRDHLKKTNINLPHNFNLDEVSRAEIEEYNERQKTRTGTICEGDEQGDDQGDNNMIMQEVTGETEENSDKIFESEAEESFYGFGEGDIRKDKDEEELLADMKFWKDIEMEKRKPVRDTPKNEGVKYWNERIGNILKTKETWSLWEIDCLIYAAMIRVKGKPRKNFVKNNAPKSGRKKEKKDEDVRREEIRMLRKTISWISDITKSRLENRKLTKKQRNNFLFIKRKYKISKTMKMEEIAERLKQRIKILAIRIKRSKKSEEFKTQNSKFEKSPGDWLKNLMDKENETDTNERFPDEPELINFWKEIWSRPSKDISEQWNEWETEVKQTINVQQNPDNNIP